MSFRSVTKTLSSSRSRTNAAGRVNTGVIDKYN